MSDNQQEQQKTESNQPAEAKTPDSPMIPKSRFDEVNNKAKELETKLNELLAADEQRQIEADKAKKKQLEEQQRFKELYEAAENEKVQASESVKTLTAKLEAMQATLTAQWEAQKGLVPELYQDLVERLDITERLQWLADNKDKLTTSNQVNGSPKRQSLRPLASNEKTPDFHRQRIGI